jgi:hypothetical protein
MSVSLFDLKGRTALMRGADRGFGLLGRRTGCAEWTTIGAKLEADTNWRRTTSNRASEGRQGGIVKIETKVGTIGILVTNAGIRH